MADDELRAITGKAQPKSQAAAVARRSLPTSAPSPPTPAASA